MSILDTIFEQKRAEVARRLGEISAAEMKRRALAASPALDFIQALRASPSRPALIAEVKRASPSRGILSHDFDPIKLARAYQANGAAAVSVLTDEKFFMGSLDYLQQIAALQPRLPLLRKDFIYDPFQVYEARAAGADAVLLIAAMLDEYALQDLHRLANELGMAALVEVHTPQELAKALSCAPRLVGVNNRDLADFSVSLETTFRLRPHIPARIAVVAESGIHSPEDIRSLAEAGVDAILVGEALVTAPDPGAAVRTFCLHPAEARKP